MNSTTDVSSWTSLPEHLSTPPVLSGVRGARSFVFCRYVKWDQWQLLHNISYITFINLFIGTLNDSTRPENADSHDAARFLNSTAGLICSLILFQMILHYVSLLWYMLLEMIIHNNVSKLINRHGFLVGTCQCNAEKDLACFFILRNVACFPTNILCVRMFFKYVLEK